MGSKDDNLPQDDDIETYLGLNLKMLSLIGFKINLRENQVVEKTTFWKKMPAYSVIGIEFYGAICQIILIAEAIKRNDTDLATEITSHIFSNILCMSKGCGLVSSVTELNALMQELAVIWRKYVPSHKIRQQILETANNTLLLCKIFVTVNFSAMLSFGLPALQQIVMIVIHWKDDNYTCDYNHRVFFSKYPFPIDKPITYFLVVLEEEYVLVGCGLFWICVDTFFAQLTTHISLQFQVLRSDIDFLFDGESSDIILKRKLITFIRRHQELLSICDRIEKIYSPVVLITVLMSSINICFNIFELSETINTGQYADASIYGFILINTFLQIVFYCVFAETLTAQTSAIGDAIYKSKWADKESNLRVYLQMLIMKSQNPFYCTAYGFFPIGHQRLTMVLNTAFSYLMMLRATT